MTPFPIRRLTVTEPDGTKHIMIFTPTEGKRLCPCGGVVQFGRMAYEGESSEHERLIAVHNNSSCLQFETLDSPMYMEWLVKRKAPLMC